MAISGTSSVVATGGPTQDIAYVPVDISAAGPDGETSGRALAVVQVGANGAPAGTTSNPVVTGSARLEYKTVAASQSAQVLGTTGATGDFLSHVIVQPTATTVGVVTVLDNATEVQGYPGGTVTADLRPFTIVVQSASVSGAWKITTGAGVKVTAYGDFT